MTTDKTARKERPITRGVLDYFPDAIAEIAHVSFIGNQQHNPGEPMHWAKGKSADHADCMARHLIERGTIDDDGLRHSAKAAWRALAMLQIELDERAAKTIPPAPPVHFPPIRERDYQTLLSLGCPPLVAHQIVAGTTYTFDTMQDVAPALRPYVYIAGPMRGIAKFNFPAFDKARDRFRAAGFNVISPADIDRATHPDASNVEKVDVSDQTVFAFRDFWSLYFIAKHGGPGNGIVLLPGWEQSVGGAGEFFLSRWLKLKFYASVSSQPCNPASFLHDFALAHSTIKAYLPPLSGNANNYTVQSDGRK